MRAGQQTAETQRRTGLPARRPTRAGAFVAIAVVAAFGAIVAAIAVLTGGRADTRETATLAAQAQPGGAPTRVPPRGAANAAAEGDAAGTPVAAGPAGEHLARARTLLEANRETVLNSTAEGIARAEREILEAFRLGAADIPGAWRVLADVYEAKRDWSQSSEERHDLLKREREALSRVLEAAPEDGAARLRYALLLDERQARMEELTRVVREDPGALRARRVLAEDLIVTGRVDEGARLLVEVAQLCDRQLMNEYGPGMLRVLRANGREQEAAQVRARMEQLGWVAR